MFFQNFRILRILFFFRILRILCFFRISEFQNFFSFRCFLRGEMKIHHKTKRGLNTLKLGHVLKF